MTDRPAVESSFDDWLGWLEKLDPRYIELGLDRVRGVYRHLPQLNRQCTRVVTVAGTNGKGTAVATLESLAKAHKNSCLAYFSPHVERFTERVRLNGVEASETRLVQAFAQVLSAMECSALELTYFEFVTLAALVLAAEEQPDLLLLEVGLGGRLDAVNLVDPDLCLITSIGLDHQDWLGNSRDAIAREKLGICRPGVALVCSDREPPEEIAAAAKANDFPLYLIGRDFDFDALSRALYFQDADLSLPQGADRLHPDSVACALVAAYLLGLVGAVGGDLHTLQVALPGRFEHWKPGQRELLLDVAHNPAAWQALADRLKAMDLEVDLLFAAMADKDFEQAFAILDSQVRNFLLLELPQSRAAKPEQLKQAASRQGISAQRLQMPNIDLLREQLLETQSTPLLATGSFYTVAFVKQLLGESSSRG